MKPTTRVLVTGANGFIGRAVVERLAQDAAFSPIAAIRPGRPAVTGVETVEIESLADGSWRDALAGVHAIIHLAGRAHVMGASALDEFRRVNVAGTLSLARQAAASGVRRFIFMSSIKVNGEATAPRNPFCADDPALPSDAYGISKMEAERALRECAAQTGMEFVIIRPPLVYGSGVKGNLLTMMRWLRAGIPLPLGSIRNARSFVGLGNLVDLAAICVTHGKAANEIFLVSDNEDLSTPALLAQTGAALGRPARLIPFPLGVLEAGAKCFGKHEAVQRLCGSLQVDMTKTQRLLQWTPQESVAVGLTRMAQDFLANGMSG